MAGAEAPVAPRLRRPKVWSVELPEEAHPLLLETEASASQEPSGYNSTEFSLIANGKFSNAYLTEK